MIVARLVQCLLVFLAVLGVAGCSTSGRGNESDQLDGVVLDSPSAVLFHTEPGTHLSVQFRDGSGASGFLSERNAVEFMLRNSSWNGPKFTTYWIDQVERIEISKPQPSRNRVY
ncbi:hypothetical protein KJ682_12940 [bacterium]|nr:hypothetical protein [bacterium]